MMGVLQLVSLLFLLSLLTPGVCHVEQFSSVPKCKDFFLKQMTPNIPGILVNGNIKDQNRYKPICQFFNNAYRFATLYDTTNKIPVFSAYKFTGDEGKRPKPEPWMIEPQLEEEKAIKSMAKESQGAQYTHQATNQDYKHVNTNPLVNRGHLFPSMHADGNDTKKSTFTLTNIVPQVETFNGGSWSKMETKVKNNMKQSCKGNINKIEAYVVTGAVPSKNPEKKEMKDRVNIPTLMWTAYCCYNKDGKWISKAHWGKNQKDEPPLKETNLGQLEQMLSVNYLDGVKVFPDICPR